MDRRSFITAAAVVPLAGSVGAGALAPEIDLDRIRHHISELKRLLAKTLPNGIEAPRDIFMMDDKMICNAYPPNWESGQPSFKFELNNNGWITA